MCTLSKMTDTKTSQLTNENKTGGVAIASGKPEFIFSNQLGKWRPHSC